MSARINLAPEVYQTGQRNKRHKRLATTITIALGGLFGVIIVVLVVVYAGQKIYVATLQRSIDASQQEIKTMPDLQKAATTQDHLKSWDALNSQKTYLTKFFTVFEQFSPQGISLTNLDLQPTGELTVTASARGYSLATKFAKALDSAKAPATDGAESGPYFTNTTLSAVASDADDTVQFKLMTQMSSEATRGN